MSETYIVVTVSVQCVCIVRRACVRPDLSGP